MDIFTLLREFITLCVHLVIMLLIPSILTGSAQTYTLYVKTPTGENSTLTVMSIDTVATVKYMYQFKKGSHPSQELQLYFAGKLLEDNCTLGDYSIYREETLHAVTKSRGIRVK